MEKNSIKHFSFSTDEYSLCLSLIGQKGLGQQVLSSIYPKITKAQVEERLVSASHSLIARGICRIRDNGTVAVIDDIAELILPQLRFTAMLQIIINTGNSQPMITNIYLSENGSFTANRIDQGVIQNLWHGNKSDLTSLLLEWISLSDNLAPSAKSLIGKDGLMIGLSQVAKIQSGDAIQIKNILSKENFPSALIVDMAEDIPSAKMRGSLVRLDISSDKLEGVNFEKANDALLFTNGKNYSWLFRFGAIQNGEVGMALHGTIKRLSEELQAMTR